MPPSTERLLARLLGRHRARAAGRDRAAPAPARPPRARARRAARPRRRSRRAAGAQPRPSPGTGLIARIGPGDGAGRRGPRRARRPARRRAHGRPLQRAAGAVMHACGHDVHMAALVALARAAHALGDELPGAAAGGVPAERGGLPLRRARQLARGELAAAAPAAVVAAHVHPELAWGTVALDPGAVNASCDAFEITVEGAALPRRLSPPRARPDSRDRRRSSSRCTPRSAAGSTRSRAASLTVGVLEAGSAENVIPGAARARGALRAHRPEPTVGRCASWSWRSAAGSPRPTAAGRAIELVPGEPPLENDPGIVARARELLAPGGPAAGPRVALHAALTTSPSSARWRPSRWRSWAWTAPRASEPPAAPPRAARPEGAVGAVARAQAVLYLAGAGYD